MTQDATIQLISLALDAALMRETAVAANIAHANIKNNPNLQVNFEQQLQESTDLDSIKPVYESIDSPISIDEQVALSVKNATHYRALIKGLNHQLAIMKLALEGNTSS